MRCGILWLSCLSNVAYSRVALVPFFMHPSCFVLFCWKTQRRGKKNNHRAAIRMNYLIRLCKNTCLLKGEWIKWPAAEDDSFLLCSHVSPLVTWIIWPPARAGRRAELLLISLRAFSEMAKIIPCTLKLLEKSGLTCMQVDTMVTKT